VPVESPGPAALPAQELVHMKRAAHVVEPAHAATSDAPTLAAPWPAASPPVFPETTNGATSRRAAAAKAEAAEMATDKANELAADSAEAILARGQAAFDRGDYPDAIRRAKDAMAAGAAVPGHLLVGDAYYHLQRYADALREYEAALALEPSNSLARRGRELAEHAAAQGTP
jgi:tetratricopeptide (TPR) repeat protein